MNLIRRDFFRLAIAALGSAGLLGRRGRVYALGHAEQNTGAAASGFQFFNPAQVRTLEAVCDRIVPPDPEFAGAKDAGVVSFIDRALSNWAPQHRWDYVAGLEGVDESSTMMFGRLFAELPSADQIAVLEAMEKGEAPGRTWSRLQIAADGGVRFRPTDDAARSDQRFFALVVGHTMQGYYADPKYGGNRDQVSWRMIGYVGSRH